ncbi:MAG: hypothetical protein HEQ17_04435 [Limnohabitans sp.]|jgi:hypothetical protein|uniref:hypothetical protein n=1 Tax=Limnohabitans sp. TaxID=1907725 RepID=UPI0025E45CFA|nr:hypothetical protein [Limnohabitans sp.]MCO4088219.1 hypothetical protein [Limnohabitans sp.]
MCAAVAAQGKVVWLDSGLIDATTVVGSHLALQQCRGHRCTGLYSAASTKRIQSGNPGTPQSGNNFQGTRRLIEGNCPVTLTRAQCLAQGLVPGVTPRADTPPNIAYNAKDFTRKRQACINAGFGREQKTFYNCMATAYFTDESDRPD